MRRVQDSGYVDKNERVLHNLINRERGLVESSPKTNGDEILRLSQSQTEIMKRRDVGRISPLVE
jgi:hypothetical protein